MPRTVTDLFRIAGLDSSELSEPLVKEIRDELDEIGSIEPTMETGKTQVLVGSWHLPLGEVTWEVLQTAIAILVAAVEPTGITKLALGAKILDLIRNLKKLIRRLDPAGLVVCRAILNAQKKNAESASPSRGASKSEIEAVFRAREETIPLKLDDILKDLVTKDVLETELLANSGPYYRVKL